MIKVITLLLFYLASISAFAHEKSGQVSCSQNQNRLEQIVSSDLQDFSQDLESYYDEKQCDPFFNKTIETNEERIGLFTRLREWAKVDDRKFLKLISQCNEKYHSSLFFDRLASNQLGAQCSFLQTQLKKITRNELDQLLKKLPSKLMTNNKLKLKLLDQQDQWEEEMVPFLWGQYYHASHPDIFPMHSGELIKLGKINKDDYHQVIKRNYDQLLKSNAIEPDCGREYILSLEQQKEFSCPNFSRDTNEFIKQMKSCFDLKMMNVEKQKWESSLVELNDYLASIGMNDISAEIAGNMNTELSSCLEKIKQGQTSDCLPTLYQKRGELVLNAIFEQDQKFIQKMIPLYKNKPLGQHSCPALVDLHQIQNCYVELSQDFITKVLSQRLLELKMKENIRSKVNEEWNKCKADDPHCLVLALSYINLPANVYTQEDRDQWVLKYLDTHPIQTLFDKLQIIENLSQPKLNIIEVDYKKNLGAFYCKRTMDVVDTIVFHHTATSENDTPERINEGHLNRSAEDPWLMIGYHYLITQKSQRHGITPKVYRGRPDNMVGAHAGGEVISREYPEELKQKLLKKKLTCGKYPGSLHATAPTLDSDGNTKANDTTLAISFMGNFSAFNAATNPTGYFPTNKIIYPSNESLREAGQLVCQLKKKYPSITKLGYHQQYRATSCPGSVKKTLSKIQKFAKEYGCTLKLQN